MTLSQLLRSFLEPHILLENILRRLWLTKLPNNVTQMTWLEDADLDKLTENADKNCKNADPHQNPINVQTDQIQQLQSAIANLTERVEAMLMRSGHIPRYHS